jgi:Protein of unknown function (DUF1566)
MKNLKFIAVISIVIVAIIIGCSKPDDPSSTISGDLVSVPRTAAYAGCYPILSTSQTGIWDDSGNIINPILGETFYGQDAQFTRTTPVYTLSSDGKTVKDEVTGLTWQKSYDSGTYYWASIQTVVDNLNKQKYGGYSDWRVPTIQELYSLWNGSTGWPWIDTNYFDITYPSEQELSRTIFWSSDKYTGVMGNISANGETPGAELAFGVNFGTGHIKSYSISVGPKHQVRCVRGNLSYGVNLFQNNNDGTISDLATGLMWQKSDSGSGMDWKNALAYAQTQNAANHLGHNDWRLPNTKELQSLVDYKRSPYATNPANVGPAINALFSCTGILNDGGKADYPYYWTSTSAIANPTDTYTNAWYVAFGQAEDGNGENLHGAGAVRFDKKIVGTGAGEERVLNYVRLVRNIN